VEQSTSNREILAQMWRKIKARDWHGKTQLHRRAIRERERSSGNFANSTSLKEPMSRGSKI